MIKGISDRGSKTYISPATVIIKEFIMSFRFTAKKENQIPAIGKIARKRNFWGIIDCLSRITKRRIRKPEVIPPAKSGV